MTTSQDPKQSTVSLINDGQGVGRSSSSLPSVLSCHEVHDTLRNQIEYNTPVFYNLLSSILPLHLLRRLYVVLNKKQFRGNEILNVLLCTVSLERELDSSLPDITLDFVLVFHQHVKL